jgi:hypothetical protein
MLISPRMPRIHRICAALALLVACGSCGDDAEDPPNSPPPPVAYNGDCDSARWSNVSPRCWSCLCGACKQQLNACTGACTQAFDCALEQDVLVGSAAELVCEIRGTAAVCMQDPTILAAAPELIAFDTCLIAQHTQPKEKMRACEEECGIRYTDDVCERFPAPAE